ncbi:hypothetical protein [Streptomyces sp. NPDC004682]
MKAMLRPGPMVALVILSALATSCGGPAAALPKTICGTRIGDDVSRLLVKPADDLHEFNRVDRKESTSAPCVLLSGGKPLLDFNFYWTADEPNVPSLQKSSLLKISEPSPIKAEYTMYAGNDGALASAPCGTREGRYFTLTLQLPQIKLADQTHRNDIEKFMRVYFPATVGTLGCRR